MPRCGETGTAERPDPEMGSIIIVVATDAPLLPPQLQRLGHGHVHGDHLPHPEKERGVHRHLVQDAPVGQQHVPEGHRLGRAGVGRGGPQSRVEVGARQSRPAARSARRSP